MSWYLEGVAKDAETASAAIAANKTIPDLARDYMKAMIDQIGPQPSWAGGIYVKACGHYHTGTLHSPGSANKELTIKWLSKMEAPAPSQAQTS